MPRFPAPAGGALKEAHGVILAVEIAKRFVAYDAQLRNRFWPLPTALNEGGFGLMFLQGKHAAWPAGL